MFVSPDGKELISGRPGRSALIQTGTLRAQPVNPPPGFGVTSAEFSPDGGHLALAIVDPKKKEGAVFIADDQLGSVRSLPAGAQFLRWLEKDRVLLSNQGGLFSHSIVGEADRMLGRPEGRTGNVITGTDAQFSVSEDGRVLIKNDAGPFHEVLRATKVNRFVAIANDLSLFGGVDSEKRLWVQPGLNGEAKVIAEGVERVRWGPISRRAVVQDANGRSRIYDGRDGSWKDLGFILEAEWSPDEERLLFVGAGEGREPGYLALFSGSSVQRLCPMDRIGQVGKLAWAADETKAFLLATVGSQADVWMIPLPPRSAGK
jgi:WD40 repeat protein